MNRILSYLIIGILIPWLFLSCAKDDDVLVGGEDNPITVSFVLSTQNVLTRAESDTTWGDYYNKEGGNDFENQINSVALIVYNGNTQVAVIRDFQYFAPTGTASDGCAESYLVVAEITEPIGETGNYRFVVVANATLKADDVDNSTYSIANINTTGIPMWGAVTKSVSTNSNVDLGTIHLLRAVAKLEIVLSDEIAADFDISKAVVTKYNTKGYVFPGLVNDESEAINYDSTLNLNHAENIFNALYDGDSLSTNLKFVVAEDKKTCHVYITEWKAIAENAKIALQFSDDNKPYEIEFKNYEGGKPVGDPHNIVRNHNYRYTITNVIVGVGLNLTCNVQPWTLSADTLIYSDMPIVPDGGHIQWGSTGNVDLVKKRVNLTQSAPIAIFQFGLSTPLGASWRAEFVTIKGKQNAFQFIGTLGGNISDDGFYATGNVGSIVELTITTAGVATDENNEAYLRISVILPDGRTICVSDILNENENDDTEFVIVQTP